MAVFEEAEGLYRIPVFTPFDTPQTNVYVLRGDRIGLVDTGLRHPKARDDLLGGLRSLGVRHEHVEVVVVTHAHVDHAGMACDFTGAEILIGRRDAHKVRDFPGHLRAYAAAMRRLTEPWGVPGFLADSVEDLFTDMINMGGSVPHVGELVQGGILSGLGPDLEVHELPGHTEGLVALFRAADGVLLSSDHLLAEITPNPGLYVEGTSPPRSGLADYIRSLDTLRRLPVARVLPGHGAPFGGAQERIEEIEAHHEARLEVVRKAAGRGRSVFEISAHMFPHVRAEHAFLALREVYGHVEILLEQGRLARRMEGSVEIVKAA